MKHSQIANFTFPAPLSPDTNTLCEILSVLIALNAASANRNETEQARGGFGGGGRKANLRLQTREVKDARVVARSTARSSAWSRWEDSDRDSRQ